MASDLIAKDSTTATSAVEAAGWSSQDLVRHRLPDCARHDIRAGLYAPLTLLIYEKGPSTVLAEYDLPSSVFGQFDNPAVTSVATELDTKLRKAIEAAARLANP